MVQNKKILAGYKLLLGLLGVSAVITEIAVLIQRGIFVPANFFSFFTIESNVFAAVMFIVGAVRLLQGKKLSSGFSMLRGAATLYMATTGIIFAVLLSGLDPGTLTAVPWDNTVLHYLLPFALVVDWLIDPPYRRIAFRKAVIWLAYPVAYLAYTLVRGHIVDWYPYPFLNPEHKGYMSVAIVSVAVAATVGGLAWIVSRLSRRAAKA
jgi:hypothetical protein